MDSASTRPPLGDTDLLVLERAGAQAMARGHSMLDPIGLEAECAHLDIDHDRWFASLKALQATKLLLLAWVAPSLVSLVQLTDAGLALAVRRARPDIDEVKTALLAHLTRLRVGGVVRPEQALGEPALLVEILLEQLRAEGLVVWSNVPGGGVRIHRVGAQP